ncbi:uncharacterized protein J8A68_003594 [[Candida] subhashii]|uniref:Importin N-terminal domain-containing protein n=1 Tax=[Candida] subhashii TaxID=561895 RepID=A0A8J5QLY9_9ASCO|nr:uncharacterized protein J8A68_003594 [[Candida] subhashii]KAG7662910.1 hypothetical protein J8A68_003594 [[Candida] subhashii]
MDKDTLLKALAGTLDANQQVRKQSEQQLHAFEEQPGFTSYLLDLITEENIQLGIQISAAIFFKNRIVAHWVVAENKQATALSIKDVEKGDIKSKLITTLFKTYKNNQIKLQLTTALNNILAAEKWEELIAIIKNLLKDVNDIDHVYTGLLCLYEYSKNYRWAGLEGTSNPVLEDITQEIFPILQNLANQIIENAGDNTVFDEMLYLIMKIFKFTMYSYLPSYFQKDTSHLGAWCQIHILIINKPLPKAVLEEEDYDVRALNPRIKAVKWCFANLNRLLSRHGGGVQTKDKNDPSNQFAQSFLTNFVPEILSAYWKIIQDWSTKKVWLSEASLYHLISFLEQLVDTPAWPLVEDKLDAIVRHVLLPTLSATQETIELYEDEPEEYIRRFFDINRESNTSDVASINFIYRLTSKKFSSTINLTLSVINEVFTLRNENRNNLQVAMNTEGVLRMLSTVAYRLDRNSSPIKGQVDKVLHTFVYPELLTQTSSTTPWLTARACDTIAMFHGHKYQDMSALQDIFQGIVLCFQNDAQFPIQLTAADALGALVEEESVADHVSHEAPQLMGNLLEKAKKFESDILTNVMDIFVQKFAKNLEPYAVELARQLVDSFVILAREMLEQQSTEGTEDMDKVYQAGGILSTLTTLLIAMSNTPNVCQSIEPVVKDMIIFIFEEAMINFLSEAVEILEAILFSAREVSNNMWQIYQVVVDCFDTYAADYFSIIQPFFEGIINHGFAKGEMTMENPMVQSLITICFNLLKSDTLDAVFAHSAFEDIELTILAMGPRFQQFLPVFLPEIFDIFSNLEAQNAFDGFMLHHLSIIRVLFACMYVDANTTLQFLQSKDFIAGFYKLWIKHSDDFQSVYGCKLQIFASCAILNSQSIGLFPEELISETVDLLLDNIAALPNAIRAKQQILSNESSTKQFAEGEDVEDEEGDEYDNADYDEDLEADEAELEAMKQTPIDEANAFAEFTTLLVTMQQQDQNKYNFLFGSLDDTKKDLISQLMKITQN